MIPSGRMDAPTRQQAWEEVARGINAAGVFGDRVVKALQRERRRGRMGFTVLHAALAASYANRALDLLDQLRGE